VFFNQFTVAFSQNKRILSMKQISSNKIYTAVCRKAIQLIKYLCMASSQFSNITQKIDKNLQKQKNNFYFAEDNKDTDPVTLKI